MANLSTLVSTRLAGVVSETNLEQGKIYTFHPGTAYNDFICNFCWQVPSAGTATIEIWGAGGSGARQCCCGSGIGGNSGAYSKKTIAVDTGGFIIGCIGRSCGNASALCFRGCSTATCITICNASGGSCSCMCAMGGRGGWSHCADGGPIFCCLTQNYGMPNTITGTGCGIVCNYDLASQACAWGGDVNCTGTIACVWFHHCNNCCRCSQYFYTAVPPGYYSVNRSVAMGEMDGSHGAGYPNGSGVESTVLSLGALSRQPSMGWMNIGCYSNHSLCQCYENTGCASSTPPAMGGFPGVPCNDVRNHGFRGGNGVVRIKFVGA